MAAAAVIRCGGCGCRVAGGIGCLQGLAQSGQRTHRQSKCEVNHFLLRACVRILRLERHAVRAWGWALIQTHDLITLLACLVLDLACLTVLGFNLIVLDLLVTTLDFLGLTQLGFGSVADNSITIAGNSIKSHLFHVFDCYE